MTSNSSRKAKAKAIAVPASTVSPATLQWILAAAAVAAAIAMLAG